MISIEIATKVVLLEKTMYLLGGLVGHDLLENVYQQRIGDPSPRIIYYFNLKGVKALG